MVLTANHSFNSSPEGNSTAKLILPVPKVLYAIYLSPYPLVPLGMSFTGLNYFYCA